MASAARQIQVQLERRRHQLESVAETAASYAVVEGFVEVLGGGETEATIWFPVHFVDEPVFTCGFSIAGYPRPVRGGVPLARATVLEYKTTVKSDERVMYRGALVAIVLNTRADVQGKLSVCFSGVAFKNPVAGRQAITGSF